MLSTFKHRAAITINHHHLPLISSLAREATPSVSQQYSPESLMVVFLITNRAKFFSTLISYLGLCLIRWPFFNQRTVTSGLVISQLSSASSPGTALTLSRSLKMCTGFSVGWGDGIHIQVCIYKKDFFQNKIQRYVSLHIQS